MEKQKQLQEGSYQSVTINQIERKSNGLGTSGFVLAILGLILGWIPILGWILWLLGTLLSFIGVFKTPKGLAIAGLVISFIGIILLIAIFGSIAAFA